MAALTESGVVVHSGYLLAQWNDGEVKDEVTSASFTSSAKPLQLDCSVRKSVYICILI